MKFGTIIVLLIIFSLALLGSAVLAALPVEEIRSIISQKALWTPSSKALSALNAKRLDAGLRAIDAYARYIPPSLLPKNTSPAVRWGIDVFPYKAGLWVWSDPGGPADQAGIPEISELRAINGKKVKHADFAKISAKLDQALRAGKVILTISGLSDNKEKKYKIKPAAFQPSSITWRRVNDDIVINIREFVAHETAPRLSALYSTLVRSDTKVVIDLRGCSGGDLYESLEVAGMFVARDLILASTYDRTGMVKTYRSPHGQKLQSPVCVLIDHRTASSAEILAGILQYHRITRLVGEQSFGKSISQTIFPLLGGGELWLTTLEIRLPDNMSRIGIGIKPDIIFPDISVSKTEDILRHI